MHAGALKYTCKLLLVLQSCMQGNTMGAGRRLKPDAAPTLSSAALKRVRGRQGSHVFFLPQYIYVRVPFGHFVRYDGCLYVEDS